MEPVYDSIIAVARTLWAAQGIKFSISGVEHIPTSGPGVVAINHTGYLDFLPVALGVRARGRRIRFMIKSEMMDIAIMRFLINHTKTVPVDRSAGHEAYEAAVASLRDGELLGVYPEATISRSFEIKDLKSGAVRMAASAGVPVIPIICWGAHRQWSKGGIRSMGRTRVPVIVEFGAPVDVAPVAGAAAKVVDAKVSELRDTMSAMLHLIQDEYPHPAGAAWVPARLGGSAPTSDAAKVIEDEEAARKAAARAAKRESGGR